MIRVNPEDAKGKTGVKSPSFFNEDIYGKAFNEAANASKIPSHLLKSVAANERYGTGYLNATGIATFADSPNSSMDELNAQLRDSAMDKERQMKEKIQQDMVALKRIIGEYPTESVLAMLAGKSGRAIRDDDMKKIMDYIMRKSSTILGTNTGYRNPFHPIDPVEEQKAEDAIHVLINKISELPGTKSTLLMNMYPSSAVINVSVDNDALDDDELEAIAEDITKIIDKNKPEGLEKLEVIYKTKEVY